MRILSPARISPEGLEPVYRSPSRLSSAATFDSSALLPPNDSAMFTMRSGRERPSARHQRLHSLVHLDRLDIVPQPRQRVRELAEHGVGRGSAASRVCRSPIFIRPLASVPNAFV